MVEEKDKDFGSGYFGEWVDDEFGLPAYLYTCDQINDPKAKTVMNKEWRSDTEHLHQVGNDRIVGVASNYGYVQVRQDEGGPKYLNEYDPTRGHFAGGIGYLSDGVENLCTYYSGKNKSFERIFGIGYYRKKVKNNNYEIDQIIFAPFGDDPVILSQTKITNNKEVPCSLRWIEYWGCNMYQFSSRAYISLIGGKKQRHPRILRQEFSREFLNEFSIIDKNLGIMNKKTFKKKNGEYDPNNLKPSFDDYYPPDTFLVSLDGNADVISNNSVKFFGDNSVSNPTELKSGLNSELEISAKDGSFLIQRNLHLKPGESITMYFLYGYLPNGFELTDLILKYQKNLAEQFSNSCQKWIKNRIELDIKDEPWVNREIIWHNYYLRAAMTYDEFFKEHILSQGHVYQYIIGFQGAARDPLQHALPFIFSEPNIVKNVIRYTLKQTRKSGEIPYGITGSGQILPVPYRPSDQQLWLLWLTSEYILGTRDINFLKEEIPRYPIYTKFAETIKIKDHLHRCYNYFVKKIGFGKHDLVRLSNGDWNDVVVVGHISEEKHNEIKKVAESVLNSAMAIYTFQIYSEMLKYIGEIDTAKEVLSLSNKLREAVRLQWSGKWLRRAWLTEDLGWIGEDQMWLEPQPWALIGDAIDQEKKEILVNSINDLVRKPSKLGAMLISKGLDAIRRLGEGTNAGIWPSINGTLVWGLSLVDGKLGWDEWKKNTLAYHAENYPEIWYGIWSGPDTYNSELSDFPGQTIFKAFEQNDEEDENLGHIGLDWTDFPVFNLHPHAWPIFNTKHLIGINFLRDGIDIKPILPKEEYRYSSSLIGFEKNKKGYSGWYHPLSEGSWKISILLNLDELQNIKTIKVNSSEVNYEKKDGRVTFEGTNHFNWNIEL
jgi:hypothetical protein